MADLIYPFTGIPDVGEAREVASGVFWIRMPLPFGLDHINLWALADGEGWTLVDTGIRSKKVQIIWEALFAGALGGKPVRRLICTHHHPDHFGLAGWLCERLNIELWMSRAEYFFGRSLVLDAQPTPPPEIMAYYRRAGIDAEGLKAIEAAGYSSLQNIIIRPPSSYRRIRDGETLTIGGRDWNLISGSGHSPEHMALHCPSLGLLISGDQVLPRISSNVSVGPTEPAANPLADWLQSLERFKLLPADTLVLPAHNEPFRGLRDRLEGLIDGHLARLAAIKGFCNTPMTAVDMIPLLFRRKLDGIDFMLGLGECLAHIHYLVDKGCLAQQDDATGVRRFVTTDEIKASA